MIKFAQPASELKAITERLNASGYEYGDGPVTARNTSAVVEIVLQQLYYAVQGSINAKCLLAAAQHQASEGGASLQMRHLIRQRMPSGHRLRSAMLARLGH
ncbi:TPA: hypothetical protein U2Q49_000818 [Citrobacter koseri]|nr:hypothetical protein [Citrobacter koseri]